MSEPVVIGSETLEQFITRHGGVASTSNIAQRFGWYTADAKRYLEAAARGGRIVKLPAHQYPLGQVCSWKLPDV